MNALFESLQFGYAPQVVNGLSLGVAVILMALGLTIIFGLLDVINMAHGEFYVLGAYLGMSLLAMGVDFWAALVLVPLIINDLFEVMAQVKAAGQSILLVEQNVSRALTLCDRFYALERGRVVLSGRADRPDDVQALMRAIAV